MERREYLIVTPTDVLQTLPVRSAPGAELTHFRVVVPRLGVKEKKDLRKMARLVVQRKALKKRASQKSGFIYGYGHQKTNRNPHCPLYRNSLGAEDVDFVNNVRSMLTKKTLKALSSKGNAKHLYTLVSQDLVTSEHTDEKDLTTLTATLWIYSQGHYRGYTRYFLIKTYEEGVAKYYKVPLYDGVAIRWVGKYHPHATEEHRHRGRTITPEIYGLFIGHNHTAPSYQKKRKRRESRAV